MAQQVIVSLVDDIDGTEHEDVATYEFGLDGVTYEIDLSLENHEKLANLLAEYVASARRTGGRRRPLKVASHTSNGDGVSGELDMSAGAIREWARDKGVPLSDRGRIPQAVKDDYVAAHAA